MHYGLHYKMFVPTPARGQNTAPSCSGRAGVTPRNFGRLKAPKSGVAPAQSGDFFCVTFLFRVSFIFSFSRDLCASQGEEDGEDGAEVRNFYLLHQLRPKLAARTERTLFLGWSDPRATLGTEPCARVESLQPNTEPFRGHLDHSAVRNFFSCGYLPDRQGEREGERYGDLCLPCTGHPPML